MSELLSNIALENDKVKLVELSMAHLAPLSQIAISEPDLVQFSPTRFGSEAAIKGMIESALKERRNETRVAFAIFDKFSKEYIGSTSYGNISMYNKRLEIGWTWISKKYQGTGLNQACKSLLLSHAFEVMKIERVEMKTDLRNIQSQRAMEKIGAVREGVLRSHTLMLDGHRRDTVYFSVLKSEWPLVKTILSS